MNPSSEWPRFVGDIGGTNARFALLNGFDQELAHVGNYACKDFEGPAAAIRAWVRDHSIVMPAHGAIGIANPILGDRIQVTNNHWNFSIEETRRALGLKTLRFINDFTALALSLPYLHGDAKRQVGGGGAVAGAAIGVIGPGTGLGVSGLLSIGGRHVPIEGEGGHVTLSPQAPEETAVLAVLQKSMRHVSAERLISGPGLVTLHETLAAIRGQPCAERDSPEITRLGLANQDALCRATLDTFCALLGTAAANLALTLGARGGIFIGGGIVPRLGDYFNQSPFRQRFEDKGRFSNYLAQIPTWVITAPYPALLGAAAALDA